MNSVPEWAKSANDFQQSIAANWAQSMQSLVGLVQGSPQQASMPQLSFSQDKLQALQQAYVKEAAELWNNGITANADKRFSSDAWSANPVAAFTAAVYLLNARTLLGLAEAADTDAKTKARLRFAIEQWMAA